MISMLRPVQPYVEYMLNQDYISEFLCINKDKPKLQCHGKCHLIKEVEKQQENEPLSSLRVSLENYPIGFVIIYKIDKSQEFISTNSPRYSYFKLYHFDFSQKTFHPPDLA